MPFRMPTSPRYERNACLSEVNRCIVEAEASSSAHAAMLMIPSKTGFDASEAADALWADMDALATLRSLRWFMSTRS